MARFTYEVDLDNAVKIWDNELDQSAPCIYQPHYPDNITFSSKEDAENWAKSFIDYLLNPPAPVVPEAPTE